MSNCIDPGKGFHYKACGLPNVWLANGYTIRKTAEGEVFHIEHIKDLHEAIGLSLVKKEEKLTPKEFRFLRTEMKLSRAMLGEAFENSSETVKKWEQGDNPITKPVDVCLRYLYLSHIHNNEIKDLIESINKAEKEELTICLQKSTQGWQKAS